MYHQQIPWKNAARSVLHPFISSFLLNSNLCTRTNVCRHKHVNVATFNAVQISKLRRNLFRHSTTEISCSDVECIQQQNKFANIQVSHEISNCQPHILYHKDFSGCFCNICNEIEELEIGVQHAADVKRACQFGKIRFFLSAIVICYCNHL